MTLMTHGERGGDVNVMNPREERDKGCCQGQKHRLQGEQIDTGGEPTLGHNRKARQQQQRRAQVHQLRCRCAESAATRHPRNM